MELFPQAEGNLASLRQKNPTILPWVESQTSNISEPQHRLKLQKRNKMDKAEENNTSFNNRAEDITIEDLAPNFKSTNFVPAEKESLRNNSGECQNIAELSNALHGQSPSKPEVYPVDQ